MKRAERQRRKIAALPEPPRLWTPHLIVKMTRVEENIVTRIETPWAMLLGEATVPADMFTHLSTTNGYVFVDVPPASYDLPTSYARPV